MKSRFAALGSLLPRRRSLRAEYDSEVCAGMARFAEGRQLTAADLAPLPPAVQRYIRLSGALGQPRPQNFRARFHGRIRGGPKAPWLCFRGEQHNFYDQTSRLFLMSASRFGAPIQAFHRFIGASATMQVKLASLVTLVDASGPEMDEAETVTLFNDACVFAPGTLPELGVQWQEVDRQTVRATYVRMGQTACATLSFNEHDELVSFSADGRAALSADAKSFRRQRWQTPLHDYRAFGHHRLMSRAEAVWCAPSGPYDYLQLELDAIDYDVRTA